MESSNGRKTISRSSKLSIDNKTKVNNNSNSNSNLDLVARAKLNRALGFADPPLQVFALGKDRLLLISLIYNTNNIQYYLYLLLNNNNLN